MAVRGPGGVEGVERRPGDTLEQYLEWGVEGVWSGLRASLKYQRVIVTAYRLAAVHSVFLSGVGIPPLLYAHPVSAVVSTHVVKHRVERRCTRVVHVSLVSPCLLLDPQAILVASSSCV